ncbi:uncharacterized protein DEA37_0006859 [Paragonimus westermani]|uniref:Amino acid transporter transmembrane domain-containing protein n=1 Tax=Paragonimus westermani TaxID=34504 RepID=A0A5J4NDN1_9TREM|nr:uncharacterized protein DEA37_0006859 [Paragonimus westermani]
MFITPVCMISKVQRLANMSAFALLFYSLMLVHMVFVLGGPKFILKFPLSHMNWWRPAGLIHCSPIFFASIFCQTQLHTVYAGMQYPSVSAIRYVVRVVVIVIAVAYGLTPSSVIDGETGEDGSVPTRRFRLMTVSILITCFLLSLTTNKIEVIIQLTSSLAGSLIGYILPGLAAFYAFAHHHFHKSSMERRRGTGLLCVGLFLLVSGLLAVHQHQNSSPISMPSGRQDPHNPVEQIPKHASSQDLRNIHVPLIDKRSQQALDPNQPDGRRESSVGVKSSRKRELSVSKVTSAPNVDSKHMISLENAPITELFSVPEKVGAQLEDTRIQQSSSKPELDDTNKIEVNDGQVSGTDEVRSNDVIVKVPHPEAIRNQTYVENGKQTSVSSPPDGHAIGHPSNESNKITLDLANKEGLVESIPVLPVVNPKNDSIPVASQGMTPLSVESLLRTESGSSSHTGDATPRNSENPSNRSGLIIGADETVLHPKSTIMSGDERIPSDIEVQVELFPPAAHSHKVMSNGTKIVSNDFGNSTPLNSTIDVRLSGTNSILSPMRHTTTDVFSHTAVSTVQSAHLDEGKPPSESDVIAPKGPENIVPSPIEAHSRKAVIPHKSVMMPVEPKESLSVDSKQTSNLKPPVPFDQNNDNSANKFHGDPLPQGHIETR